MLRFNVILLLVAVICAVGAVTSNHRARKQFVELEREQARMQALDVEWNQLRLEQGTWAAHARVEKIAREKLGMKTPAPGQIVSVEK